jgi:hypothetical protein
MVKMRGRPRGFKMTIFRQIRKAALDMSKMGVPQ